MRFRLTAFGLHLFGSAAALILILGALYLGWYRWPGWYLAEATHIAGMVVMIDLALGPALTFSVASPGKPARVLARDIAVIVTVQVIALAYGAVTLWSGRPLYYTFSADRLELVQASDIDKPETVLALRLNPSLAPQWYRRPRWVWAPLPDDPAEAARIAQSAVAGGQDVIDMPRYFRPWEDGLSELRRRLRRLDELPYLTPGQKHALKVRLAARGLDAQRSDAMLLWGGGRFLVVVFDPVTVLPAVIVRPD
jgi:hypothetical protein